MSRHQYEPSVYAPSVSPEYGRGFAAPEVPRFETGATDPRQRREQINRFVQDYAQKARKAAEQDSSPYMVKFNPDHPFARVPGLDAKSGQEEHEGCSVGEFCCADGDTEKDKQEICLADTSDLNGRYKILLQELESVKAELVEEKEAHANTKRTIKSALESSLEPKKKAEELLAREKEANKHQLAKEKEAYKQLTKQMELLTDASSRTLKRTGYLNRSLGEIIDASLKMKSKLDDEEECKAFAERMIQFAQIVETNMKAGKFDGDEPSAPAGEDEAD